MDNFKIWLMSLCGATAVSAVFKILLSDSSLKKVINVFFSIFILFYTVVPVQSIFDNDFDLKYENSKALYDEYYQEGYEVVVREAIVNLCNEIEVKVLSIEIDSYIDDENYLNIEKIVLQTDDENTENIKNIIKKELGFEVEVE